ncbi:MAG: SEC-C metal-binding domain-containing protein [Elusimicrobiota bacterium]|nr:SEC-C metal-binding domain-containing protein [Elusimicrobiota bacterium]
MKTKLFKFLRAGWQLLRLVVSPELRSKAVDYVERMRKDGVDVTDNGQRREWIRTHRAEISQALPGVYSRHIHSRNDPCPCGSKKKYKRCCGAK